MANSSLLMEQKSLSFQVVNSGVEWIGEERRGEERKEQGAIRSDDIVLPHTLLVDNS